MKQIYLLSLCFFLGLSVSFSQITVDTATAKPLSSEIKKLIKNGNLDSAKLLTPIYFDIYKLAQTHEDSIEHCYAYGRVGDIYRRNGYTTTALPFYKKAQELSEDFYGKTHFEVAKLLYNIAFCNAQKGYHEEAIVDYGRTKEIFIRELGEHHAYIAFVYVAIANSCMDLLDYQRSLDYYRHALNIHKAEYQGRENKKPERIYLSEGRIYNNLGLLYLLLKEPEKAIEYYNDAISIYRRFEGEDAERSLAHSFYNLAGVYLEQKNYEKAYGYMKVVKDYHEKNKNNPIDLAEIYALFSVYHKEQNEIDLAKSYSRKAITLVHNSFGKKHPFLVKIYTKLGDVFRVNNELDSAIIAYNQAISSSVAIGLKGEDLGQRLEQNFEIRGGSSLYLFEVLHEKSVTLQKQYEQSDNIEKLKEAINICSSVDYLAERMRSALQHNDQVTLGNTMANTYQLAVDLCYQIFQNTGDLQYQEKLHFFSERKKAAALSSIITSVRAKKISGIPNQLQERERELSSSINFFNTEILLQKEYLFAERDTAKLNSYYDSLFVLRQQYDELIDDFECNYEQYYQLKHKTTISSSAEIQAVIPEHTIMVSYAFDAKHIYITTTAKDDFRVVQKTISADFEIEKTVLRLHRLLQKKMLIQERHRNKFIADSHNLYNYLIAPIADQIEGYERLVIIPEGILNYLPFEVLLSSNTEINFQKMPYLIKTHDISYHYSMSLYQSFAQKEKYDSESVLLAVAPVFENGLTFNFLANRQEGPLLSSKEEVNFINHLFQEKCTEQKTKTLIGKNALESTFKDLLKTTYFDNIHLSSHGEANEMTPDLSWIAFRNPLDSSETKHKEDGFLYASEVYDFQLQTNLLVLSSCESGLGKLSQGEGMISLNRGFLYAGALNVIYSIWKVNDKYTCELMKDFYSALFTGQNYAQALRQSKLNMIERSETAALPNNWAGFLLLGQ